MFEYEVKNRVPILLAISTCPRCMRMKKFLSDNKINAKIIDIDLVAIGEKKALFAFIRPKNPTLSFPMLIVGDLAVIGEEYDGAKEALHL